MLDLYDSLSDTLQRRSLRTMTRQSTRYQSEVLLKILKNFKFLFILINNRTWIEIVFVKPLNSNSIALETDSISNQFFHIIKNSNKECMNKLKMSLSISRL